MLLMHLQMDLKTSVLAHKPNVLMLYIAVKTVEQTHQAHRQKQNEQIYLSDKNPAMPCHAFNFFAPLPPYII